MTDIPLKSSIEGIDWPAVPDSRGAALLALLYQLEQSQWWSPERLRAQQGRQLVHLLRHAQQSVPFYAKHLAEIGTNLREAVTPTAWTQLPLLTRADIQTAGQALISRSLPASHGGTDEIFTSGSTGKPIRALRSQIWGLFWSALTLRDHFWHRRDLTGKLATIRESGAGKAPYPKGAQAPNWGRSSSKLLKTGPSVSLNITCPAAQQLDWLQRQDPDYLLSHPSMIRELAELSLKEGITLPRLKQVETISEVLTPATRELCRQAWGVPLVDLYSTREAGYIALQCPDQEHYHIQSEGVFVEVLDDAGQACNPGQVGRVVVTPLHNFAMPLIRYDIGDYAEVGEACPCGRGLPVLRRILGREQNMLVMPSGERRWPLLSSGDIRSFLALAPVRQYQFVQSSPVAIELHLSVERAVRPEEEAALRRWVQEKFGHPFEVTLHYAEEIPRSAAGKYQDFISGIEKG